MKSLSTRIPKLARVVRSSPAWPQLANQLPLAPDLARQGGGVVTDHASSWVRQLRVGDRDYFAKTYEYGTWPARLRSLGKRTAPWSKSRADREFEALAWLRDRGLAAPEPIVVLELRSLGFLVRATLVTAAFPGQPADRLLPSLAADGQLQLARAIGRLVGDLHTLGFRDRNLDLRNLLAEPIANDFRIAKIDSGRFVLRAPGVADDRLTRADWQRLLAQLPPDLGQAALVAAKR